MTSPTIRKYNWGVKKLTDNIFSESPEFYLIAKQLVFRRWSLLRRSGHVETSKTGHHHLPRPVPYGDDITVGRLFLAAESILGKPVLAPPKTLPMAILSVTPPPISWEWKNSHCNIIFFTIIIIICIYILNDVGINSTQCQWASFKINCRIAHHKKFSLELYKNFELLKIFRVVKKIWRFKWDSLFVMWRMSLVILARSLFSTRHLPVGVAWKWFTPSMGNSWMVLTNRGAQVYACGEEKKFK